MMPRTAARRITDQQFHFPVRPVTVLRQDGLDEPVLPPGQGPYVLEPVFAREDVAEEDSGVLMCVVAGREGSV